MTKQLKTDEEWVAWGKTDPMYGVASWRERRKDGSNPWTKTEFYELGQKDWADFWRLWCGYRKPSTEALLEIGCGGGRMSKVIADTFKHVFAIDVAPGMLEFAKKNIRNPNIDWLHVHGIKFPIPDVAVDAIFSCHVFQHLESTDIILKHFAESFRVLRPGGSLCVHLPVHSFPVVNRKFTSLVRVQYRCFLRLANLKAAIKRARMRRGGEIYMHGISIEQGELLDGLNSIGFKRIQVSTIIMQSNNSAHTCVLASKEWMTD